MVVLLPNPEADFRPSRLFEVGQGVGKKRSTDTPSLELRIYHEFVNLSEELTIFPPSGVDSDEPGNLLSCECHKESFWVPSPEPPDVSLNPLGEVVSVLRKRCIRPLVHLYKIWHEAVELVFTESDDAKLLHGCSRSLEECRNPQRNVFEALEKERFTGFPKVPVCEWRGGGRPEKLLHPL